MKIEDSEMQVHFWTMSQKFKQLLANNEINCTTLFIQPSLILIRWLLLKVLS